MINTNGKYITIPEAAEITGKHITTIYKAIRRSQLTSIDAIENYKTIKKVLKSDVVSLYGNEAINGYRKSIENQKTSIDDYRQTIDVKSQIKEVIEEYFQDRETKLMKPLEEQSLYRAGELNKENQFLKVRLETVLQENEELRASIKALPAPPVEVVTRLAEQSQQLLEKEQEAEILRNGMKTLEKDKIDLIEKQEKKEQEIEKLKEAVKTQVEEVKTKEDHYKKEEEDLLATIEALKSRLEDAEKRPWWKFW